MKSSLIPESPILVYPSLAATVGLDESVMLSALSDLVLHAEGVNSSGYQWYLLSLAALREALPFWDRRDLHRVCTSLREKGIILLASAPLLENEELKFAFNEQYSAVQEPHARPQTTLRTAPGPGGKNFIAANWQPDQTTLEQLAQLSIPAEFARQQIPEFVTYWRERNEAHRSWGQKFISHTLRRWRTFEAREHRRNRAQPIPSDWSPMAPSLESLQQSGVPQQFMLDQVREFIVYWQASGERHLSWDSKFIQHVQARWADLEARKNVSSREFQIFGQWRPSADAIDVMHGKSAIPMSFIEDAIPEFIIYWQEKGVTSNTWNSLFIKHVRLQWHRYQHALDNAAEPQTIADDWQPAAQVYDILTLANIDAAFARELIPEFVLYWKERNDVHRSWSTRFLQHVKRSWAMRHQLSSSNGQASDLRSTREISLEEELNDTSWAD